MKKIVYVEKKELMDELGYWSTPLDLEKRCSEAGFYFTQDDMYNCYVSIDEECDTFEEYCEL